MPGYWEDVTLTYQADEDKWSGVVVSELVQFTGTLFSVLNELDEYMRSQNN